MRVPSGVWTSALSISTRTIWATRSGSQRASMSTGDSRSATSTSVSLRAAAAANSPATWLASVRSGTGSSSRSIEPASRRDRSSRSVVSFCRRSTCSRIVARNSAWVSSSRSSSCKQLDEPAQREDRGAQLVRGVRDELLARAVETREPVLHLVERARELAQLVVGVDRDGLGEVAGRDLAGAALEALHAPREGVRGEVAGRRCEQQREQPRDQDLALDRSTRSPRRRPAAARRPPPTTGGPDSAADAPPARASPRPRRGSSSGCCPCARLSAPSRWRARRPCRPGASREITYGGEPSSGGAAPRPGWRSSRGMPRSVTRVPVSSLIARVMRSSSAAVTSRAIASCSERE